MAGACTDKAVRSIISITRYILCVAIPAVSGGALTFGLVAFAVAGPAGSGVLRFPLPNEACPTSSFGSWRPGHLHAGMDFSTGGVTGMPVLAVDTCRVVRIRIWNGGYGKALYARLADGKVAVYGHLSRFEPRLERLVEARQDIEGSYEVELLFEENAPAYGPGDTLAFSGETGSGPPHLHFELRSGGVDHYDINPVPGFLDLAEDLAPIIKAIRLEPLGPWSSVNGTYGPVTFATGSADGVIRTRGPFGVSVGAVDPVQCGRILHPVRYEAWVDSVCVWMLGLDRFPFARTGLVGGIYEITGNCRFVRLFDPFGLDFSGFTISGPGGAPTLRPGSYVLKVRVADAWGNADEVRLDFTAGPPVGFSRFALTECGDTVRIEMEPDPRGSAAELAYREGGDWQPMDLSVEAGAPALAPRTDYRTEVRCRVGDGGGSACEAVLAVGGPPDGNPTVRLETALHRDYVEITGEASEIPSRLPAAVVRCLGAADSIVFQPAGAGRFRAVYVPPGKGGPVSIRAEFDFGEMTVRDSARIDIGVLEAGGEAWFTGRTYRVRLKAPASRFLPSLVSVRESSGRIPAGFASEAGRLEFEPRDVFFGDGVEVLVVSRDPETVRHLGVFADHDSWVSLRGLFDERGRCEFEALVLENLAILEDSEGPVIGSVTDFRRRSGDGKAVFSCRIGDSGSGVDALALRVFVDDVAAIAGIDPDDGRVSARTIKALPSGMHRIRLEAEDRMGNRAGREFTVDLLR